MLISHLIRARLSFKIGVRSLSVSGALSRPVAKMPYCRETGEASMVRTADRGMMQMPIDIKTDQALLNRLVEAAQHIVGREELRRQRVSFIYGNLPTDSTITRHQIEEALARIEGTEPVAA